MDGKVNRRVLDIATPVLAEAQKDRPDVSFRVRVIDSPEINAFSIPGGYIYIYRGLLDKIGPDDDDALACVIGHEAAHVVRRHVVKQMSDSENKGLSGGPGDAVSAAAMLSVRSEARCLSWISFTTAAWMSMKRIAGAKNLPTMPAMTRAG